MQPLAEPYHPSVASLLPNLKARSSSSLLRSRGFCWFLTQAFQEPIDSTLLPTGKCFQVLLSPYLKQTCRKKKVNNFYFASLYITVRVTI